MTKPIYPNDVHTPNFGLFTRVPRKKLPTITDTIPPNSLRQMDSDNAVTPAVTDEQSLSTSGQIYDDDKPKDVDSQEGQSSHEDSADESKARWAISKKAKLILEQIYQMERFPSAEMRRRLADDFQVHMLTCAPASCSHP